MADFPLEKILEFSRLLNKFRLEKRVVRVNGEDRQENDVEHSYQLAMLTWFLIDSGKLKLDRDLAVSYALVHDLVEVYAGDTYIYTKDLKHKESKDEREADAAKRIASEFPEFGELHKLIENYEHREDPESRFVYALDKIQPIINIYLDGGHNWRERSVTLPMLVENKKDKVKLSPEVEKIYNELFAMLKDREKELFGA